MTLARRLIPYSGTGGGGIVAPPSYDEEFAGENVEWSLVTPGGSGDWGVTTPGKLRLHNSRAIRTRVPAAPFTVTARCSYLLFDDINSVYANASVAIGGNTDPTGSGDRHYAAQWDVANLGHIGFIDGTWASYSSQVHQNSYVEFGAGLTYQIPHYQRMTVHSGTNIDIDYGTDGVTWTNYITGYDPSIDVEAVLLLSYGCTTEWDWVRFT